MLFVFFLSQQRNGLVSPAWPEDYRTPSVLSTTEALLWTKLVRIEFKPQVRTLSDVHNYLQWQRSFINYFIVQSKFLQMFYFHFNQLFIVIKSPCCWSPFPFVPSTVYVILMSLRGEGDLWVLGTRVNVASHRLNVRDCIFYCTSLYPWWRKVCAYVLNDRVIDSVSEWGGG